MPIQELPLHAISTLISSQALTDPSSVVKELLENSIDALATSVAVEISPDTTSIIQIKDNGRGIPSEDRHQLCKRHHTSKIREFSDLKNVGARSLGFRGEALASAVEMSGALQITTRTDADVVAAKMSFKRNGQLESIVSTSHPRGTTVRVMSFLQHLPVRRQAVLKNASKTLARIKQLMQAYALARPSVRLSLKVLQAKSTKADWTYVPKSDATTEDSVLKIFGKDVARQCQWVTKTCNPEDEYSQQPCPNAAGENTFCDNFKFEAMLPKRDADLRDVSDTGQFVSIDLRPMSCSRGPMKQISQMYKQYLFASNGGADKIKNPFLCLRISCPQGSYDPNVEPAKDDVLFEDPSLLLSATEMFFRTIYNTAQETSNNEETSISSVDSATEKPPDLPALRCQAENDDEFQNQIGGTASFAFDVSKNIAKSSQYDALTSQLELFDHPLERLSAPSLRKEFDRKDMGDEAPPSTWRFNMYGGDEEESNHSSPELDSPGSESADIETEDLLKSVNLSNPWVIAKMNAPKRQQSTTFGTQRLSPIGSGLRAHSPENFQVLTPRTAADPSFSKNHDLSSPNEQSTQFPSPQYTRQDTCPNGSNFAESPTSEMARRERKRARALYGKSALDTHIQHIREAQRHRSNQADEFPPTTASRLESTFSGASNPTEKVSPSGFISARLLPQEITNVAQKAPVNVRKLTFQPRLHKPFVSPLISKQQSAVGTSGFMDSFDRSINGYATNMTSPQRQKRIDDYEFSMARSNSSSRPGQMPANIDLENLLDYERRKEQVIQQQKELLLQQSQTRLRDDNDKATQPYVSPKPSPHKNRYDAAVASLAGGNAANANNDLMKIDANDPRAYLIRMQNKHKESEAAMRRSGKRLKTAMLPLERIHPLSETLALRLNLSTKPTEIARILERDIISGACMGSSGQEDMHETAAWDDRLDSLMQTWYHDRTGETSNARFTIAPAVKEHFQHSISGSEDFSIG